MSGEPWHMDCADFQVGACCTGCHESGWTITVYPESAYSEKYATGKLPDLSLGISGHVCCGRFEEVKRLPRGWWIRRYAEKKGWKENDIAIVLAASPEKFLTVCGEISSKYWRAEHPDIQVARPQAPRKGVRAARGNDCPGCGNKWDGNVCNNCGHAG